MENLDHEREITHLDKNSTLVVSEHVKDTEDICRHYRETSIWKVRAGVPPEQGHDGDAVRLCHVLWCCSPSALYLQTQRRPRKTQSWAGQVSSKHGVTQVTIDASIGNTSIWPSSPHLCTGFLLLVTTMDRQSLRGIQPSIFRKLGVSAGQAHTKHLFLGELLPALDTIDL